MSRLPGPQLPHLQYRCLQQKAEPIASQALTATQPFHTGGRSRARTPEVQGAKGRVEDPCPIRVLLWLQAGGSQGLSSHISNIVPCSSAEVIRQSRCCSLYTDTDHAWGCCGIAGIRGRTSEAQGAQGRVEDPCPIRVLLWLQGGSQGHSSCISNIVVCGKKQSP